VEPEVIEPRPSSNVNSNVSVMDPDTAMELIDDAQRQCCQLERELQDRSEEIRALHVTLRDSAQRVQDCHDEAVSNEEKLQLFFGCLVAVRQALEPGWCPSRVDAAQTVFDVDAMLRLLREGAAERLSSRVRSLLPYNHCLVQYDGTAWTVIRATDLVLCDASREAFQARINAAAAAAGGVATGYVFLGNVVFESTETKVVTVTYVE
jgi:hypothetical protein